MDELISYPIPGKSLILQFDSSVLRILRRQAAGALENRDGLLLGSLRDGDPRWITIQGTEPVNSELRPAGLHAVGYYSLESSDGVVSSAGFNLVVNSLPSICFAMSIAAEPDGQVQASLYIRAENVGFAHERDYQIALPSEGAVTRGSIYHDLLPPINPPPESVRLQWLPTWCRQLGIVVLVGGSITWLYLLMGEPPGSGRTSSQSPVASGSAYRTREEAIPVERTPVAKGRVAERVAELGISKPAQLAHSLQPPALKLSDLTAPGASGSGQTARSPVVAEVSVLDENRPSTVVPRSEPETPQTNSTLAAAAASSEAIPGVNAAKLALSSVVPEFRPADLSPPPAKIVSEPARPNVLAFVGPKPMHRVTPAIPASVIHMLSVEAQIDVTVKINAQGRVTGARVSATRGGLAGFLASETLQAAKLFTFDPARENNQPVESTMVLTFRFMPPPK